MASNKRAARRRTRRAADTTPSPSIDRTIAPNQTTAPVSLAGHLFYCEGCSHEADATYNGRKWNIGSFDPDCPGGSECLRRIAEQVGCKPYQLLEDPRPWLAAIAAARPTRQRRVDRLPVRR